MEGAGTKWVRWYPCGAQPLFLCHSFCSNGLVRKLGRWSENGQLSNERLGGGQRIQYDPIQCTLDSLRPIKAVMAARHRSFGSGARMDLRIGWL